MELVIAIITHIISYVNYTHLSKLTVFRPKISPKFVGKKLEYFFYENYFGVQ